MTKAIKQNFPRSPSDVTKHWFASTIGKATSNQVSAMELVKIGEEQGASALVYLVNIAWTESSELPETVILKFASDKAEYREYAKSMGTYLKEVRFYQNFGSDLSLLIPHTYFAEIDEESGDFLIVMEDLTDARMAQWFADSVGDVKIALVALAEIHAKYWNDKRLWSLSWLGSSDDKDQCNQYKNLLEQVLPPAKAEFSNLLSDYSWSVLDTWLINWESVRLATSIGAKTLVHREADMRQMFFPTPRVNRFVLFDWQSLEVGWGSMDACRMIVTSLSVSARRQYEQSLVTSYAHQLRKNGIGELTEETLWHQIKLSLLMNVLAHLFSLLWVETKETEVWQRKHLAVLGVALEDWKVLDAITQLKQG